MSVPLAREVGPRKALRAGFTLLEMMVVLAIIAVVFGMTFSTMRAENKDAKVQSEAERLAAVLRQTRNRSIAAGKSYGVAFNITNGEETSGAVLNNWSGGHWYRVVGPRGSLSGNHNSVPIAGLSSLGGSDITDFIADVEASWIEGEQYFLPSRSVRFLALSDTDEGPRRNGLNPRDYQTSGEPRVYPLPWFGYYDQASNRLYPWGGYDPDLALSGFHYQGSWGSSIADSLNPDSRTGVWTVDEPRPVVNAEWLDACILFNSEGEARFLEWNRARRAYEHGGGNIGLSDRAKAIHDSVSYDVAATRIPDYIYTGPNVPHSRSKEDNGGVAHFYRYTGGYHITLAPDATVDSPNFGSVDEAIESITPAWRVYIGRYGNIRTFRVQSRKNGAFLDSDDFLSEYVQRDLTAAAAVMPATWPPDPDDWYNDSAPDFIYENCRTGWLHEVQLADDEGKLVPADGGPIVDKLTGRMLTDRIWWVK